MTDNAPLLAVATPQIKADEGCELNAYPDSLSALGMALRHNEKEPDDQIATDGLSGEPWTIGYGATGASIGPSTCWTQDEADQDLNVRLEALCASLDGKIPWWREMNLPRQAVLLNMSYNLGVSGLLGFHNMLAACESGKFSLASDCMLVSRWATQVRNRAERLAAQMESGIMQNGETS